MPFKSTIQICFSFKGNWTILELTDKGEEKLKGMGIKTDEKRSRGGTIHNFYIHLIKKELIKLARVWSLG